jgi:glutathione S-transferase
MLRLYIDRFWISPYALSNFVALEEKGLPYELVELGLDRKDHRTPAYVRDSLTGRVPALWHDGFWLSESNAINEYLAETFPAPKYPRIYPENLEERGRARQLSDWVRSDLMAIRDERSTHTVFYAPTDKPLSPAGRADAEALLRVANALIVDGRPERLFTTWCIADLDLAMMLRRLTANGEPVPDKVRAFVDAQWERPAAKKWLTHPRPPYVAY